MSEAGNPLGADGDPVPRSRRSARFRTVIEFVLLFVAAVVLKQLLVIGTNGPYPNPLWLPVIVLSLQHGLAAGLTATLVATALQFSGGWPPALMTDDMYTYISRVAAEPVSWACVALLIGHIRSRQIAQVAHLQAELTERTAQCTAIADLCADLRSRTELLERHIAANATPSNVDLAEAIRELHDSAWDNFAERLTRFVVLMTGTSDYAIYLLRNNALTVVFQPSDEHSAAAATPVPNNDALFAAIVNERRTLSAARPLDRLLLGTRGNLIGPILDNNGSNRVIGMFAVGDGALDDYPEDIERRFSLTLAEISRLVGQITLIESWHAATPPRAGNGHLHSEKTDTAAPRGPEDTASPQVDDRPRPGGMTLQ